MSDRDEGLLRAIAALPVGADGKVSSVLTQMMFCGKVDPRSEIGAKLIADKVVKKVMRDTKLPTVRR